MKNIILLIIGVFFGIVMYKSEAASWYRIYEMFNFQAFHMFGIIGSALAFGVLFISIAKRKQMKDFYGQKISIQDKEKGFSRYIIGGATFGMGWALAGACPGPMYVLLGTGTWSILIVVLFALLGTFLYGLVKNKLPH